MTLAQLQQFQAVCQQGGVTKAARALHLTQPTVSVTIRELEREFGVELFHRADHRLQLTGEGAFLLEQAADLLARAETLADQMRALGGQRNRIRVGVPPMIGSILFPPLYHAFHSSHPEITVEITEEGSLRTEALLEEERLDLALLIFDERTERRYHALPLLETEYVYCVGRDHPMAGRERVAFSSLLDQQMILFGPGSVQNREIRKRFAEAGGQPDVLLFSSNQTTISEYLRSYRAGAFLFRENAALEADLAAIPLDPPWSLTIGLIWKRGRPVYSDTARFIQFARAYSKGHR